MGRALGEFEHLVMLALVRLRDDAYGVTIKEEIEAQTGREIFVGAVYTALARMQAHGYVSARVGEPTARRGGRRKKYYRLADPGREALRQSQSALRGMAEGIEAELDAIAEGRS
jgi:DNA-binding PadR family transcriptional regulator